MIAQNRKGISAVIATIMLLMITVALIGVFYVFSSGITSTATSSGGQQVSQITSQLAMCMQIDNINGNKVDLRNCGKGVIENKSLVVTIDDIKLDANTNTIAEGNSSVVNVSGLWQIPFGKHNLKISNGATFALALVDVQPNRDGLVGLWNFDEGSGNKANDGSGNGNIGTLLPLGSEPTWVNGRFGKGLQFDGVNDYVDFFTSIDSTARTQAGWFYFSQLASVKGNMNYLFGNLYQHSANNYLYIPGGSDYFYFVPSVNTWYYIVFTWTNSNDDTTSKLYINGGSPISISQQAGSHAIPSVSSISSGNPNAFSGTIDEVRIWSKALAPDETVAMKRII